MEVLVGGGMVVDVATKEDMDRHFSRLADLMERPRSRFERYAGAQAPRAANAAFGIRFPQPKAHGDEIWELQWLALYGDDPTAVLTTAIANVRAALFVGSRIPDAQLPVAATAGLDHGGAILPGLAVPSLTTIPDKNVVYPGEEPYVLLYGTGLVAGAGTYHALLGVIAKPNVPAALTW